VESPSYWDFLSKGFPMSYLVANVFVSFYFVAPYFLHNFTFHAPAIDNNPQI